MQSLDCRSKTSACSPHSTAAFRVRPPMMRLRAGPADSSHAARAAAFLAQRDRAGYNNSPPMPLSPGARLGPYEILDFIGAGGMGEVYRARDTRLNRTVAIKIAAAQFSERFESEARAVAALNHPHICTLFDVGPDYLVMEYIEG